MSGRHMVKGLVHKHMATKDEDFFALIDATGGWPLGYKFIGFEHTEERAAGFTNSPRNDGWWTVTHSADDYYIWKLSPEALQRIGDAMRAAITLSHPIAHKLYIRNSRGSKAVLQKAEVQS